MGIKKRAKKAASKAKNTATKATNTVVAVANKPVVRVAATAAATVFAGPQGTAAVNQAYNVMNNASAKDLLIGAVSPQYLITKSQINKFKNQYSAYKNKSSALSVLVPQSNSSLSSKISTPKRRSFVGAILDFFGL